MKWITKLLEEKRERQIKIQDRMIDLEAMVNQLDREMALSSSVVEIAAKEILSIKATLNRNGMNDTVVTISDSEMSQIMKEGNFDEQP